MGSPYYNDGDVTLHHGDAHTIAQSLPTGSVQTIVTSPPYFGLRDYGTDGQLGAEPTVQEYVGNLVTLFQELRRVLADDGTAWINLGDSYGDGKNLLGVPWRVAFGLQDDGWILRSDIIWAKKNVMPESVTDRPTKAHEYLFLLARQPRYYYNGDAIREPLSESTLRIHGSKNVQAKAGTWKSDALGAGNTGVANGLANRTPDRNKRDVWTVATQPFNEAHFAVYPPELIRPCILAGSRPGDTILDPFSGSGTTGYVANQEGRKYVGIDLNAEYLDLSLRTRFAAPALNIWDVEEPA